MKRNVSFSDVLEALERLNGVAHRTPVVTSRILNKMSDQEVM
jgi:threonine dehydratase